MTKLEAWLEKEKRMYEVDNEINGHQCFVVIEKMKEALEIYAQSSFMHEDELAKEVLAIDPEKP